MYSVFRSPTLIERKNIQTENSKFLHNFINRIIKKCFLTVDVSARKPRQLSARTPFSERSANLKGNGTPMYKPQTSSKSVVKVEPSFKHISLLICSYKYVKGKRHFIHTCIITSLY